MSNRWINGGFGFATIVLIVLLIWPTGLAAYQETAPVFAEIDPPLFWHAAPPEPIEEVSIVPPMEPGPIPTDLARIYRQLPTQDRVVALTIDDGPRSTLPEILKILAKKDVPATFFLLGSNAVTKPNLVNRIVAQGHDIANHTWGHPKLTTISPDRVHWQIENWSIAMENMGVETQPYMRPPYGSYDDAVLAACANLGYHVLLWDVDSRDWEYDDPDEVLRRSLAGLKPGSIVLFHDGPKVTTKVLPRFIDEVRALGYRFVLLSDYIP